MLELKYKKHPLSYIPGGCKITIVKVNGSSNTVTWVKYPERYIGEILELNNILSQYGYANGNNMTGKVYLDDDLIWSIEDEVNLSID